MDRSEQLKGKGATYKVNVCNSNNALKWAGNFLVFEHQPCRQPWTLQCSDNVLRLQQDADAWHTVQRIAFGAAHGDTVATEAHKHAVPVLEGTYDGHAALCNQIAFTQVDLVQVGQDGQDRWQPLPSLCPKGVGSQA